MATLLVLLIMFLFGSIPSISQRYVFVDDLIRNSEGETCCQRLYGTSLASIHSDSDNLEAQTLCAPQPTDERPSCQIGLNDYAIEADSNGSNFVWTDGSVLDYQNWTPGEPNDYYAVGEDWVVILKSTAHWNDERNGRSFRLLCNFGTKNPTATCGPTLTPTVEPSKTPSSAPSDPTRRPTSMPSLAPSKMPSAAPSKMPSIAPSKMPSIAASVYPTEQPSDMPNAQPPSQLVAHLPGGETTETTYILVTLVDDEATDTTYSVTKNEMGSLNQNMFSFAIIVTVATFVVFILCFICLWLYRAYWKPRKQKDAEQIIVRIKSVSRQHIEPHINDDNMMMHSDMTGIDGDMVIIDKMIEETPAYGDVDTDELGGDDDMEIMEEIVATVGGVEGDKIEDNERMTPYKQ
eukprot:360425_1